MPMPTDVFNPVMAFIRGLSRWRPSWMNSGAADLARLEPGEFEHLARDVGVTNAKLRVLAGRWPNDAALLSRRLADIGIDESKLGAQAPQVLRDLQRVCTLCDSRRRCEHDFENPPSRPNWHMYCPNSQTLAALQAEPCPRRPSVPQPQVEAGDR